MNKGFEMRSRVPIRNSMPRCDIYRVSNYRVEFSYALVCKGHACTLRFWTNPHKIKRMIYLKKLFDYEWTMSYEVSKNSKNPENI